MDKAPPHTLIAPVFPENEGQLLRQLANGDIAAYTQLYTYYHPMLATYLYPFKGIDDPEEIIQEIFLKVWLKKEMMAGLRNFRFYLFRMARNKVLDVLKSKRARLKNEQSWSENVQGTGTTSPGEPVSSEFHRVALKALEQLPPRRRRMYEMSVLEDNSLEEISRKMSVSRAVVTKQLYLASKFVRSYLRKHGAITWLLLLLDQSIGRR